MSLNPSTSLNARGSGNIGHTVQPMAMAIFLHAQKPSIGTRLTDLPSNFMIPRYCDEELNYQKEKSLLPNNLHSEQRYFDQNMDIDSNNSLLERSGYCDVLFFDK